MGGSVASKWGTGGTQMISGRHGCCDVRGRIIHSAVTKCPFLLLFTKVYTSSLQGSVPWEEIFVLANLPEERRWFWHGAAGALLH
jgi:hypothetical protein